MACLFPFYVNDVPVPCGKCPKCLVRRTDSWAFRLLQQERISDRVHWITLSYDPATVPMTDNGYMSLCKRDVQLFMKRLRFFQLEYERQLYARDGFDYFIPTPIKYFLCGEYGSKFQRPHYHVFLFNSYDHLFDRSWIDEESRSSLGLIYIDPRPITAACIGYTVGYMFKKRITGLHARDDRASEFLTMSRGLGLNYLTDEIIAYHKADLSRNFITLPGGTRSALPRYFADRLYTKEDKELRSDDLDASVRAKDKRIYDEHVRLYGSADDFIRSNNAARHAAVSIFQSKHSKRKDL